MKNKLLRLAAVTIPLALGGCTANRPMTLNSLTVNEFTSEVASQPLYAQTDKFSFSTAFAKYPANGGYHTVPVGNYFLIGVLNALPAGASDVRLSSFTSVCKPGRFFLPNVICTTSYMLAFQRMGMPIKVEGQVTTDVGLLLVKDDELLLGVAWHRDYGDDSIVGR